MSSMQPPGIPTLYAMLKPGGTDPTLPKIDVHDFGTALAIFGRQGVNGAQVNFVRRSKEEFAEYFQMPVPEINSILFEYNKAHRNNKAGWLDGLYRIATALETERGAKFWGIDEASSSQVGATALEVVEYSLVYLAEALSTDPPNSDNVVTSPSWPGGAEPPAVIVPMLPRGPAGVEQGV